MNNQRRGVPITDDEWLDFFTAFRQALLMIVAWIERKYKLRRKPLACPHCGGALDEG